MRFGIISAMEEENHLLLNHLKSPTVYEKGLRTYTRGMLWGIDTVLACSRWGKVAAAVTAAQLIIDFEVDHIIFTGVAGAVDPFLRIGDIVLANNLVQHDLDPRPLFDRFEVPFLGEKSFHPNPTLYNHTKEAILSFLEDFGECISATIRREFQITEPRLVEGLVASGDQFFADKEKLIALRERLPETKCVEMEGAAVAQVCYEYAIPYTIIRTISDEAGAGAHIDFQRFIRKVASLYAEGILKNLFDRLAKKRSPSRARQSTSL